MVSRFRDSRYHLLRRVSRSSPAVFAWLHNCCCCFDGATFPVGYPDGQMIGGIKWKKTYGEIRLTVHNTSSARYNNLDAIVRADIPIEQIGFITELSRCKASYYFPGMSISGAVVYPMDKNGQPVRDKAIPLFTPESGSVLASEFRISCDRLLAGDKFEAVIATINVNSSNEKANPSWVSVDAEYDAFGRTRSNNTTRQCLTINCKNILAPDH